MLVFPINSYVFIGWLRTFGSMLLTLRLQISLCATAPLPKNAKAYILAFDCMLTKVDWLSKFKNEIQFHGKISELHSFCNCSVATDFRSALFSSVCMSTSYAVKVQRSRKNEDQRHWRSNYLIFHYFWCVEFRTINLGKDTYVDKKILDK